MVNRSPKTEIGTRDWEIAVIGLTIFLLGGMWALGLWIRKTIGHYKGGLMGNTSKSMEDSRVQGIWLKKFQRKILTCGLEIILLIFWQKCVWFSPLSKMSA